MQNRVRAGAPGAGGMNGKNKRRTRIEFVPASRKAPALILRDRQAGKPFRFRHNLDRLQDLRIDLKQDLRSRFA